MIGSAMKKTIKAIFFGISPAFGEAGMFIFDVFAGLATFIVAIALVCLVLIGAIWVLAMLYDVEVPQPLSSLGPWGAVLDALLIILIAGYDIYKKGLKEIQFKEALKQNRESKTSSEEIQTSTSKDAGVLHYLASPYSHSDLEVMESRRVAACLKAGELIANGVAVISPIAHNVAVIREINGKTGWDRWQAQDLAMLSVCQKVLVLRLLGWETSKGVAAEIKAATELGIPVEYIDP